MKGVQRKRVRSYARVFHVCTPVCECVCSAQRRVEFSLGPKAEEVFLCFRINCCRKAFAVTPVTKKNEGGRTGGAQKRASHCAACESNFELFGKRLSKLNPFSNLGVHVSPRMVSLMSCIVIVRRFGVV